jgi:hypothetical protein
METDNIINQLNQNGYYIIKNFINNNDFKIIRKYWLNYFKNIKIQNTNNNIHKTGIILGDKNYLAKSKKNSKENDMLRLVQYLWNEPHHELTFDYGIKLHKIRNLLTGKEENYGLNYSKHGIAMYLQTNFYKAGKGFMSQHVDGHSKNMMLNFTFNVTFKNNDFEEGGITINKNNKLINLDDLLEPTDALVFDGNLKHQVKKIISKKNIGRIGIFPIIHKLYYHDDIPVYLKKIAHGHNVIKRILGIKKREKLPNEF